MTSFDHQIVVIGAGSGGVRTARMAAARGDRVAIVEHGPLGGTCVNVGCVPKKLMVYAAGFADAFADAAGFGWQVESTRFSWADLITATNAEVARLNGVYRHLLDDAGVDIVRGRARITDRHTVSVEGRPLTTETIVVATGGRPRVPAVPGAELGIVSDALFTLPELPQTLAIIGGGYIALEFASIMNSLGVEVSLLYRGPLFLRGFDDDIRTVVAAAMTARGVELCFETTVESLAPAPGGGVSVRCTDGAARDVDLALWAVGRIPNTVDLGLEEVGVELAENGAVVVDATSRTSVPGIYAVGDCTDRMALTPVAIAEAMALVETLHGKPTAVDHRTVATAVFSRPEVATVGLTEAAARSAGHRVVVYRSTFRPMLHSLSGRQERTMMKLVVDGDTDRVLGVHMVGPDAAEIIQGFAVALTCGATKAQLDATIGIHPTAGQELVTMRVASNED